MASAVACTCSSKDATAMPMPPGRIYWVRSAKLNVDLGVFGHQYVLRAGLPRIDTHLTLTEGHIAALRLRQRPARTLQGDTGGIWPMKLRVRLGYETRADVILDARFDGAETRVAGASGTASARLRLRERRRSGVPPLHARQSHD